MTKTNLPEPKWRILAPADLAQLKKRVRELLTAYRASDPKAVALFNQYHPSLPEPVRAKLADAQLTFARAHDFPSWPKFKHGIEMFNGICADDPAIVTGLIRTHPQLLHDRVNGITSNWGPPLVCAAQVGSQRVFEELLLIPGQDQQWALDRATLKGRIRMAHLLMKKGAEPAPDAVMGPCETLNIKGLQFLADIGAPLSDNGDPMAPIALLLEGYYRNPEAKHACLALFAEQGIQYPDTSVMAFHRGRIDLLDAHLEKKPGLLSQRFTYREIYPFEMGCHDDESLGLHGTPLDGTTLLHMAVDFDEMEIAKWLIAKGANVDQPADKDRDGFGGHTALFNTVVSQAAQSGRQKNGRLARLLLTHGANPNHKASIRKGIRFIADETVHEYKNVTPVNYGEAFHEKAWVSTPALELIRAYQKQP